MSLAVMTFLILLWSIYYLRNFLYLLQATGGPHNPNFQVVVMHASHVYTVASMHSFGLPLRMNGIHGNKLQTKCITGLCDQWKVLIRSVDWGWYICPLFCHRHGAFGSSNVPPCPRELAIQGKKGNIANARGGGGVYRAVAVSTNYGIGGVHLKAFSFISDTNYSLLLLPNSWTCTCRQK